LSRKSWIPDALLNLNFSPTTFFDALSSRNVINSARLTCFLADFSGRRVFIGESMTKDSQQLLADYATNGSETAFRELVTRYIDLVFSTALRLVEGDVHRAQETAQAVFIDLARQAPKLSPETTLGGWLHRDTCFIAAKVMRGERRRHLRERQAAEMDALNQSDTTLAHLAPVLDEAINELGEEDRKAIVLRFYEQMDLRSVGLALGSSENAAQKRVTRALDQLRLMLTRRGVTLTAAALGTVLAGEAVTAAPAGLAATITMAALSAAVATSGVSLSVFKAMSLTKIKLSALSAFAVIAVATPLIVQHQSEIRLREENQSLHELLNQDATIAEENQRLSNLVSQAGNRQTLDEDQLRELLRLRGEVGRLRQENKEMEALRQESQQLHVAQAPPASGVGGAGTTAAPKALYTRMLKVDAEALVAHLKSSSAVTDGNSTQDAFHQAALRQFLKNLGVEMAAPESVFMDETNGTLTVHASLENLDKIEQIVVNLGVK
jgi:RNA polymerase sigma factor (sigma-70 family)